MPQFITRGYIYADAYSASIVTLLLSFLSDYLETVELAAPVVSPFQPVNW